MKRRRKGLLIALALTLVVAWLAPSPVRADDLAAAKAHFLAATAAYHRADYTTAIREFQAAYQAKPNGVVYYNMAQCEEKMGDLQAAMHDYNLYLRETPRATDRTVVEEAIANLERRFKAQGVQVMEVYSEPTGAQVSIDDTPRGKTTLTLALPPGPHRVVVTLAGFTTSDRTVNVAPDRSLQLDVVLQPVPPMTTPAPPMAVPRAEHTTASTTASVGPAKSRVYTWVAAAVAGAALAGGAILGTGAQSQSDALRSPALHSGVSLQKVNDDAYGSARSQARGANVLYGLGAVAGAAAVTLFFVEGHF